MMISGRISRWLEFRFWQLAVRVLDLVRPVGRLVIDKRRGHAARPAAAQSQPFAATLMTALAGWGLGLLLGFLLMRAWF
jgi:hypothetical protein